nr:MAG TPA: hypothetical protein [Caudoviricetes sp.]
MTNYRHRLNLYYPNFRSICKTFLNSFFSFM